MSNVETVINIVASKAATESAKADLKDNNKTNEQILAALASGKVVSRPSKKDEGGNDES
jgi:hypothetical protein